MTSFNPLATILSKKPLDESNYDLWKTNLYIVHVFERMKFITSTTKRKDPTIDVTPRPGGPLTICQLAEYM